MNDYILTSLASFLNDNPTSPFQRGYLAALLETARAAGLADHSTYQAAQALLL
ncbi:hypothetical protein [Methylobacterium marchantiae]|uniref:Uncharacterized protein n=1 Tax=Methylobacterium marchantiae TaxID=600331 RepID=A0ABW3X3P4_9HYPH|nr:hypothetical protein AIGOOFII_3471 [Methylobacterium marchantiae]